MSIAGYLLAAAWLILPAVQYFAAVQRTDVLMEGSAPYESLATLDLTPGYVALLALTALFAVVRLLASRRAPGQRGTA